MTKRPITIRVDPTLLAAVRHRAREENRTLTNFIETILRQRVAAFSPTNLAAEDRQPTAVLKDQMKHEC